LVPTAVRAIIEGLYEGHFRLCFVALGEVPIEHGFRLRVGMLS